MEKDFSRNQPPETDFTELIDAFENVDIDELYAYIHRNDEPAADDFREDSRVSRKSKKSFAKNLATKGVAGVAVGAVLIGGYEVAEPAIAPKIEQASRNVRNVFSAAGKMLGELNPTAAEKADAQAEYIIGMNGGLNKPGITTGAPAVPKLSGTVRENRGSADGTKIVVDIASGEEWILNSDGSVQQYFPPMK